MPVRDLEMGPATRDAYGKALVALGHERDDIVAMDADLSKSTKSMLFGQEFPDRYWNIGIQEANMVGMAAGLASTGQTVFISSFAVFLIAKGFDQIRMNLSYADERRVKLVGSHGGISIGEDGPSQQAIEDVGMACLLPGFTVCVPADAVSAEAITHLAAAHDGGVYIRTGRPKVPVIYGEGEPFELGKAKGLESGSDVAIIANGLMVAEALKASDTLRDEGINATVLDMHTVKPLDRGAVIAAARECGCVVTAEEHLVQGGLGAAVAQCLGQEFPVPIEHVGILDTYAESGKPNELLEKYGLTYRDVADAARKASSRKTSAGVGAAH